MEPSSILKAGRPASILIAILGLSIAYWLGWVPNTHDGVATDRGRASESVEAPPSTGESNDLLHGLLRETTRDQYVSPEGLVYGPGSAEGHRLAHLRRHTQDDPQRGGSHGVFDGGMEGALKTIDLAYKQAKTGQRTSTEREDDRTIYTVDLGARIGYVGGATGARRGHPTASRIRIVLEGNHVVTAFPM